MKQVLIAMSLCLATFTLQAQNDESCEIINLKTEEDIKTAEPCILKSADYLLSTPLVKDDPNSALHVARVLLWMDKTTYTFTLNGEMAKIADGPGPNKSLFGIYLASMAKAAIENKAVSPETAVKFFADYVSNGKNNVKQTGAIKKFLKDVEGGDFSKYV